MNSAVARTPDSETPLVQLTPITVDGGTTVAARGWALERATAAFRGLLEAVRRGATVEDEARRKRTGHRWFLRIEAAPWMPERTAHLAVDAYAEGARRQRVSIHAEGLFYVTVDLERGNVSVQLKARELWAGGAGVAGYERIVRWLIVALHRELFGEARDIDGLCRTRQWHIKHLEACVDWHGLAFWRSDAGNFTGGCKQGDVTRTAVDGGGDDRDLDAGDLVRVWGRNGGRADTIDIGARSARCSMCLYRKTLQILQAKDGDASTYAPAWISSPDYDSEREVQRVEIRLNGDGLVLQLRDAEVLAGAQTEVRRLERKLAAYDDHLRGLARSLEEALVLDADGNEAERTPKFHKLARMIERREANRARAREQLAAQERAAAQLQGAFDNPDLMRTIDLTDPRALFDAENLRKVWAYTTQKMRLIERTRTRIERCPTDPRWASVQDAAGDLPGYDPTQWRQARVVQRESVINMTRRNIRGGLRAFVRQAGLTEVVQMPMHDLDDGVQTPDVVEARRTAVRLVLNQAWVALTDCTDDDAVELVELAVNHRARYEHHIGQEMETLSRHWTRYSHPADLARDWPTGRTPALSHEFWEEFDPDDQP